MIRGCPRRKTLGRAHVIPCPGRIPASTKGSSGAQRLKSLFNTRLNAHRTNQVSYEKKEILAA